MYFFYSFLFLFSPHVRESGFWNPGNFCFGIRNPGLSIPEYSSKNPTNNWNPESTFHWQRIPNPGNFCWWNPEYSKFLLWKPESWALRLKESGISLTIGIQNPSSTNRDWNPVPEIRNSRRGIQTPSLFWLPLRGTIDYITNNVFFTLFLSWFYRLPAIWSLAGFTTIGRTLVICTVKLLGLTVVISQCSWLKQSTP